MIHTLEYLKREAEQICGYWDGSSEKYIDHDGEVRTEEDAQNASDLLKAIQEVRLLAKTLSI